MKARRPGRYSPCRLSQKAINTTDFPGPCVHPCGQGEDEFSKRTKTMLTANILAWLAVAIIVIVALTEKGHA